VNFPLAPLQAVAAALTTALKELRAAQSVQGITHPRMTIDELRLLLGFPQLEERQQRFLHATSAETEHHSAAQPMIVR